MTNLTIKFINATSGEEIEREMNEEELEELQTRIQTEIEFQKVIELKTNEKTLLLEKLGITADEAALLLS